MRKKIAKILELWPVFLLSGIYYVSYFNPDFFIAPMLLLKSYSKPLVVLVVGFIGFLELLGGYKGWSGMRGLVEKWLKDTEFVKKLRGEKETKHLIEGLQVRFTRKYLKFTSDGSYYEEPVSRVWLFRNIDKVFKQLALVLKSGGLVMVFGFSLVPIPGLRVGPDILCGTTRWKVGFVALAIGNFLKTVGVIYGWSRLLL